MITQDQWAVVAVGALCFLVSVLIGVTLHQSVQCGPGETQRFLTRCLDSATSDDARGVCFEAAEVMTCGE